MDGPAGVLISTAVRRQTRAQTYVLLTYAASIALLSSADPELSVLGPVGFFLATRLGP